jgi:hypothetical protein
MTLLDELGPLGPLLGIREGEVGSDVALTLLRHVRVTT